MPDDDVAISIDRVSKCYRIYDKPRDRFMQLVSRGKRDYFREFWALRDLSLTVRRGDTMGIVGRNGAGKSTLLQLVAGTLTPTAGNIQVNGRVAALLELGAGFNPEFTGRENIVLNAMIHGFKRAEIDARMDDILAFADIGDFVDQPIKTYSSGMYLRLAFSVIAHVDADILIVDEALAVGDAIFTQRCMRFLRKFQETGTLLFVSHDSAAVLGLCNRAVWLDQGRERMSGTAKDVSDAYLAFNFEAYQGRSRLPRAQAEPSAPAVADTAPPAVAPVSPENKIEFFDFNPDADGFGQGDATVSSVEMLDEQGNNLRAIRGGEYVTLCIRGVARERLARPIIGFYVKDRLGQNLFGDNTYLTHLQRDNAVPAGGTIEARFGFEMPFLPPGSYSIGVGFAEGTQELHVMQHWIHDALIFKSQAPPSIRGLVGVPMRRIDLESKAPDSEAALDTPVQAFRG